MRLEAHEASPPSPRPIPLVPRRHQLSSLPTRHRPKPRETRPTQCLETRLFNWRVGRAQAASEHRSSYALHMLCSVPTAASGETATRREPPYPREPQPDKQGKTGLPTKATPLPQCPRITTALPRDTLPNESLPPGVPNHLRAAHAQQSTTGRLKKSVKKGNVNQKTAKHFNAATPPRVG